MRPARVVGSRHDHNVAPGCQTATNVRAHKDRLPFATWETRMVLTMPGWDLLTSSEQSRDAARARTVAARNAAIAAGNVTIMTGRRRSR